jgi:hypothetical protein
LVTGAAGYANVPPGTRFDEEPSHPCVSIEGNSRLRCGPRFVGATPDLSHVVLGSGVALTSTPTGGNTSLYEWSGGKLALVSLLPGGEVASGARLGFQNSAVRNAISADGSRVVWSAITTSGLIVPHLYMRDLALGQGETVQLDAVQGGSGEGNVFPKFQIASSDSSRVFFTDEQALTKDSGARENRSDLYECEVVVEAGVLKCRLSDLTPLHSGEPGLVQGAVLGASEDGSYVYFVANGALPGSGAPVHGTCQDYEVGQVPVPVGLCNLYVWHDGATSLVAVLSEGDEPDWQLQSSLPGLTARVSSDGRRLAFMSERSLTGYDTTDAQGFLRERIGSEFRVLLDKEGKPVRAHDEEVYLYDAATGSTSCASCNPTGARPVGMEYSKLGDGIAGGDRVWGNNWLAANIPGWTPYEGGGALYQSRYLSDSGRLFFNSSDALVPQDVNGTEDVYEFEPPGVGGCSSSSVTFSVRSGGCVGLVSSGGSSEESGFLDASSTGGDVFFLTSAKLLGQDFDSAVDVYDAHECSAGSPCISVPVAVPPVCDTGDACKPAPSPQPVVFGAPSSATFTGAGNTVLPGSKPVVRTRGLTRAQKLARALRVCRQKKQGSRRQGVCERRARARYGVKRSSKANAIRKGGR